MHEDERAVLREHEVRAPRDILYIQPKSEAARMQHPAKRPFRFGILPSDPGHHAGAGLAVYDIGHVLTEALISSKNPNCGREKADGYDLTELFP